MMGLSIAIIIVSYFIKIVCSGCKYRVTQKEAEEVILLKKYKKYELIPLMIDIIFVALIAIARHYGEFSLKIFDTSNNIIIAGLSSGIAMSIVEGIEWIYFRKKINAIKDTLYLELGLVSGWMKGYLTLMIFELILTITIT